MALRAGPCRRKCLQGKDLELSEFFSNLPDKLLKPIEGYAPVRVLDKEVSVKALQLFKNLLFAHFS